MDLTTSLNDMRSLFMSAAVSLLLLSGSFAAKDSVTPYPNVYPDAAEAAAAAGVSCGMTLDSLVVDKVGLQRQIDELATFSDTPAPSVTRVLYTESDVAARKYIINAMQVAGLTVREDAIGNIFGRWEGSDVLGGVVGTGSHIDALPFAGKYDGVVGVLGAIEAVRTLKRAGFTPKRSLEVIMFTSEEPTRFGFGCLGSRAIAGAENIVQILRDSVDGDNVTFTEAARKAGYLQQENSLDSVAVSNKIYSAFIELHIEQGPTLEEEGLQIGIVTAIAAPASITVELEGDGGHAGAALMPSRNDAGLAGAELSLAVEQHVLASGSIDTVGTTGVMKLHPGAVNSIPRGAHLEIDVRDIDGKRRDDVVQRIHQSTIAIAEKRKVRVEKFEIVNQDPPAQSGASIVRAAVSATEELGFQYKLMKSRAYHDSLFMARVAPMGMIFIPCYRGYSHRPDEYSSEEDIVRGVQVLALTLSKLSVA